MVVQHLDGPAQRRQRRLELVTHVLGEVAQEDGPLLQVPGHGGDAVREARDLHHAIGTLRFEFRRLPQRKAFRAPGYALYRHDQRAGGEERDAHHHGQDEHRRLEQEITFRIQRVEDVDRRPRQHYRSDDLVVQQDRAGDEDENSAAATDRGWFLFRFAAAQSAAVDARERFNHFVAAGDRQPQVGSRGGYDNAARIDHAHVCKGKGLWVLKHWRQDCSGAQRQRVRGRSGNGRRKRRVNGRLDEVELR